MSPENIHTDCDLTEYTLGGHKLSDYPWTFYFNGKVLPKWSGNLSLCRYDLKKIMKTAPDERWFSYDDLVSVRIWLGMIGRVDSYDWDLFCGSIKQLLIYHLTHKKSIVRTIRSVSKEPSECKITDSADLIYSNIAMGLEMMMTISSEEKRAFWATGYETENQRLIDCMRCCELPNNDPEFQKMPHRILRNLDFEYYDSIQNEVLENLKANQRVDLTR